MKIYLITKLLIIVPSKNGLKTYELVVGGCLLMTKVTIEIRLGQEPEQEPETMKLFDNASFSNHGNLFYQSIYYF